jgi:hypothetical protein
VFVSLDLLGMAVTRTHSGRLTAVCTCCDSKHRRLMRFGILYHSVRPDIGALGAQIYQAAMWRTFSP